MNEGMLAYSFREVNGAAGDVVLELFIEGALVGTGRIGREMLGVMHEQLGMDRGAVTAELRKALLANLAHREGQVTISELREEPARPLRFVGRFTYQGARELQMGAVWYDVTAEDIGPEAVPEEVRHKMRHEVLRRLTAPGTVAREVVEMHDRT